VRSVLRSTVRSGLRSLASLAQGWDFASPPPFAGFRFCRHIYVTTSSANEFDAISISASSLCRPSQHPAIASALATQRFLGETAQAGTGRRLVRRGLLAAGRLPGDGA
jgi:hypothetical protein